MGWLLDLSHDYLGYSPHNTPHLAPAVELEDALLALTRKLPSLGLPTTLNSSSDLDKIVPHIKSAIDAARLYEYYVFDIQASVKAVAASLQTNSAKPWEGEDVAGKSLEQLSAILREQPGTIQNYRAYCGRYDTRVQPDIAAGFARAAWAGDEIENQASKWGKVLDVLNVDLYNECNDDVQTAIDGVVGRLRYTRLEQGGPKMGEINEKYELCSLL